MMPSAARTTSSDRKELMRAVQHDGTGASKLRIVSIPVPEMKKDDVLIKVVATAINRADILQREGKYPPPPGASPILGLEVSGVIAKVSENCTKWAEGDRVMALLSGGGYAEYVAVNEDLVMPIPKKMGFQDAAAIPEAWLTAYQLLHTIGNIQPDQVVLVHGGGSGVGLAAVQLAKLAQAKVYVTAGTEKKIETAVSLGATKGFNYKEEAFAPRILEETDGKGANIILDCVGESFWQQNADALAIDGHWILFGLLSGYKVNGDILAQLLKKRAKLEGTTLRSRSLEYQKKLITNFASDILQQFDGKSIKSIVHTALPLGKISEAHRLIETNQNIGKVVVLINYELIASYDEMLANEEDNAKNDTNEDTKTKELIKDNGNAEEAEEKDPKSMQLLKSTENSESRTKTESLTGNKEKQENKVTFQVDEEEEEEEDDEEEEEEENGDELL